MTLSGLASEIGISDASLNRKMSGKSDFTRLEIQHIRMVLRMTPDEADAIFLRQNLRKRKSGVKNSPHGVLAFYGAPEGRSVRSESIPSMAITSFPAHGRSLRVSTSMTERAPKRKRNA